MAETLSGLEGVAEFDGKNPIVIEKDEIELTLPHRDTMLLLDRVTIDKETVAGEFDVTEAVCKGHAVAAGGKIVMRGSDLFDMAAQLLGVWAAQNPAITKHPAVKYGGCFVREYGGAKFREAILPKYRLIMEAKIADLEAKISEKMVIITGSDFTATVNDSVMAVIHSVKLVASVSTISEESSGKPEQNSA